MTADTGNWPQTIPAAARRAADRWPDAPALIEGKRSWTFAQVWADALSAAAAMVASGLQPGDRVGIWAPNTREWILAALGAHCVGAAIIPLNTRFTAPEATDILRRAKVRLLFAAGDFLGRDYSQEIDGSGLPSLIETIRIDSEWDAFVARGTEDDASVVSAAIDTLSGSDISDIMFTSGTTGKPKGVLTSHHQAVATFGNWAQRVDLREGDVYLIVNPFFHTFGYKAGWVAALVQGATIVPQQTFDVPQTVRLIEEHGVSFIPGPPTIYQSLLQELAGGKPHDFSTLRVAVTGAAPVAPELVRRMRSELGMRGVVNGYGMTECGAISMTCKDDDAETIANTCGYPLPGLEVRCIDEEDRELPPGEAGEFVVRGHSVMQGYLDDPEATAETIDAEGWLHTGDIGILDERGYLKITDRKKDMFICGGFNVYPAEVERTLAEHPAISACAVIGIADERLGEVSKAFVVLRKDAADDVDVASIVAWARKAMANYKVPREVELVEDLPRNAAGKVVKAELRS